MKCETCQYYIKEDEKGYPFCCLYCMPLDNIAIFDLCNFIKKEDKKEND